MMDLEPIAWAIGAVGVAWAIAFMFRNGFKMEFRDLDEKRGRGMGYNPPPETPNQPTKHRVPPRAGIK